MKIEFAPGFEKSMERLISNNPWYLVPRMLRDFRYEVKYAWQRVFRGWDDPAWYSFYSEHSRRTIETLTYLKKNHNGHPGQMSGSEEWVAILDKMIDGFMAADSISRMEYHDGAHTHEEREAKREAMQKRFENGMVLFTEYYFHLWD